MIKVNVKYENKHVYELVIKGHAGYDVHGKDIVCASVSSIVICSVEAISKFDINAVDIKQTTNKLEIIINKTDDITNKLILNMINCLKEVEKNIQDDFLKYVV